MRIAAYIIVAVLYAARALAVDAITMSGQMTLTGQQQMVSGSFSAPSKAIPVYPTDLASHVPAAGPITFVNGGGATSYKVYLDASATSITPTTLAQDSALTSYTPSLTYAAKYWCRIDAVNSTGTTTGDIYSFDVVTPYSVDYFQGFEGLSVGTPSGADLGGVDTVSSASGTWGNPTITSRVSGDVSIAASQLDMYTPAEIDASYFVGTGTRALVIAQELDSVYVHQAFPTGNWSQVDVSGVIKVGSIASTYVILDLIHIANASGGYFVFQTNASFQAQAHGDYPGGSQTSASTSSPNNISINPSGGTLSIAADTAYQFRMNAIKAGICTLKIYNAAGDTLLKTMKVDLSTTDKDAYWSYIRIGRTDAHGTAAVANMTIDNLRIILSTSTTPEKVSGP